MTHGRKISGCNIGINRKQPYLFSAVDIKCHKCGAWAIMHHCVPAKLLEQGKVVERALVVGRKLGGDVGERSLWGRYF